MCFDGLCKVVDFQLYMYFTTNFCGISQLTFVAFYNYLLWYFTTDFCGVLQLLPLRTVYSCQKQRVVLKVKL